MKIQWEYDLVERPFCEQLKAMGWQWMEGDADVPDLTERANFREVFLKARLATALRKLNLRGGEPWLDDDRIRRIIEKLERADGHRLADTSSTQLWARQSHGSNDLELVDGQGRTDRPDGRGYRDCV
jgi:type I restriction enzyme, R subunit